MMGFDDEWSDDDGHWGDDNDGSRNEEIAIAHHGVVNESPKAWLILLDNADLFSPAKEWFPKSRCRLEGRAEMGDSVIWVPSWLVDEKEIWDYQDQS